MGSFKDTGAQVYYRNMLVFLGINLDLIWELKLISYFNLSISMQSLLTKQRMN